jgi:hypothetical protein
MSDPLRQHIEDALDGEIDPDQFELCACELLREVFPGVFPIAGGTDDGFDGGIPTPEGPLPLVCTVGQQALDNLRRNLGTYLQRYPNGPKQAVFATPRSLTPRRRRNLEQAAADLGVALIGTYEKQWFAERLYGNSTWRRRLLRVSGQPSALRPRAVNSRSDAGDTLFGREAELDWLRNARGDTLLVGQPGSGKTFLHEQFAADNNGLFVADRDQQRIADGIRDRRPGILIVDDAHLDPSFLATLRAIRDEIQADFRIAANCWPGYEDECKHELQISGDSVNQLLLLPLKTIVELVRARDDRWSEEWLGMIARQARGRPGLAIELARSASAGIANDVWSGEKLFEYVAGRRIANSPQEHAILAAFSIGGEFGLPEEVVAEAVGMGIADLRDIVTRTAAAGVLVIRSTRDDERRIAVEPYQLRAALARRVFFDDTPMPPPLPGLLAAADPRGAAETLCGAKQRGAEVPVKQIEGLVVRAGTAQAWNHFAHTGPACAARILDRHPERVPQAASGILRHHPERGLAVLVQHAASESTDREAVQELKRWLEPTDCRERIDTHRRSMLLDALLSVDGCLPSQAIDSIVHTIMSRECEALSSTADGDAINIQRRRLAFDELTDVAALWPRVLDVVQKHQDGVLATPLSIAKSWAHEVRSDGPDADIDDEASADHDDLRALVREMLTELAARDSENTVLAARVRLIGVEYGLDVDIEADPHVEWLFGDESALWSDEPHVKQRTEAIVAELAAQPPSDVIARFVRLEQQALLIGVHDFGRRCFYAALAERTPQPEAWVSALTAADVLPDFVYPFLDALQRVDPEAARAHADEMLQHPSYRLLAARHRLHVGDVPSAEVVQALAPSVQWGMLYHVELTREQRLALLSAGEQRVRQAAVISEHMREPKGPPTDPAINEAWLKALADVEGHEVYMLRKTFEADPDIAAAWLIAQIEGGREDRLIRDEEHLVKAASVLSVADRKRALGLLRGGRFQRDLWDALVGEEDALASDWFRSVPPPCRHKPLRRGPGARWLRLVKLALAEGVAINDVENAMDPWTGARYGPRSAHYAEQQAAYSVGLYSSDPRVRRLAKIGVDLVDKSRRDAEAEEYEESVFGR